MKKTIILLLTAMILLLALSACIQAQQPSKTVISTEEMQQADSSTNSLEQYLADLNDLVDSSIMVDTESGITDDFFQ